MKHDRVQDCPEWASRPPRGGCGLKHYIGDVASDIAKSPPSRGVWIETPAYSKGFLNVCVAPLAGGVD